MENQHRKISGYRELSQEEIDLMNEGKELAEKVRILHLKINNLGVRGGAISIDQCDESSRCLDVAREKLQTGFMWLVRSVALPETF